VSNPYDHFDAAPPASNPYDQFDQRPVSTGQALAHGALDTATYGFADEMHGLDEASGLTSEAWKYPGANLIPPIVGGFRMAREALSGNPGDATAGYDRGVAQARATQGAAQEQHPTAYMTGQIGGALVGPGFGAARGVTMGARALNSARAGAITGGLYGIGSGENPEERAIGGVVGAGIGGAAGGVLSPVADVAAFGVNKGLLAGKSIYDTIRAEVNPSYIENEASRRVVTALGHDVEASGGQPWDADAIAAANQAGIPRSIADAGGETTMALARSSANQSPEARAALTDVASERFAGQAQRGAQFVRDLTGGGNATQDSAALQDAARRANAPAYKAAYTAGDQGIWSPELERLTGSPDVVDAMKSAATKGKTRAIADGFGAFNPGVTVTDDGRLMLNRGPTGVPTYPNLQFWDYTYRSLRDSADAAFRSGRNSEGTALKSVSDQLRTELDNQVPEFQQARQGAAQFFGAQDALEAGQKFVTATGQNAQYAPVIAKMSPPERELFARGYASTLADRMFEVKDNQNLVNQAFVSSPAARQRTMMALGSDRAGQLEAYVRAEGLADRLRTALGNSTTARQLAEMGLAGAGAGVLGEGVMHGDWDSGHLISAGLLLGSAYGAHRVQVVQKSVARRVGEMLASNDPAVLRQGVNYVARSQNLMGALRNAGDVVGSMLSPGTAARATVPQIPRPTIGAPYGAAADQGPTNQNQSIAPR
jgi:hypothetical protein